jgi:uncharacterized protein YggE
MRGVKLAAAGLALLALLALPASGAITDQRTITVIGSGEAEADTTPASWTFVARTEFPSARAAVRATNAAAARVAAALRGGGITDFRTGELSLYARPNGDDVQNLRGFVAEKKIELDLAVQRAAPLVDSVRAAGATQITGPTLSEEALDELDHRALADSLDDATEKARRLAAKAGVTLGPVLTIEERRTQNELPLIYGPEGPLRLFAPTKEAYATVAVTFAIS